MPDGSTVTGTLVDVSRHGAAVQGLPAMRPGERGELTVTGIDFPAAFDVLAIDHGIDLAPPDRTSGNVCHAAALISISALA